MSGAIWYFALNNQQQGPISQEDLRNLFATGQLPAETLVWSQSLTEWTAANQLAAFSAPTAAAPPAPNMVASTVPASAEPHGQEGAPQQPQLLQGLGWQPQIYSQPSGSNGHTESTVDSGHQSNSANTAAGEEAKDYTDGGFQTTPEQFHFQQAGVDGGSAQQKEDWSSAQEFTAEEQSARLREIVAQTAPPSTGTQWGNLDAIPTPKPGGGGCLAPKLDAISTPSASLQTPVTEVEPIAVVRAGGLGDSVRPPQRADTDSPGAGDSGSFVKGTARGAVADGSVAAGTARLSPAGQTSGGADEFTAPQLLKRWFAACIMTIKQVFDRMTKR